MSDSCSIPQESAWSKSVVWLGISAASMCGLEREVREDAKDMLRSAMLESESSGTSSPSWRAWLRRFSELLSLLLPVPFLFLPLALKVLFLPMVL